MKIKKIPERNECGGRSHRRITTAAWLKSDEFSCSSSGVQRLGHRLNKPKLILRCFRKETLLPPFPSLRSLDPSVLAIYPPSSTTLSPHSLNRKEFMQPGGVRDAHIRNCTHIVCFWLSFSSLEY
ncbi:unnamed protein product [Vicia faba]|uniref:Uncharacterized protein n=1 Tax=Vicia faba TaxID=3906 RepID=A0AAV0ZS20_VICFA|nr:unnamed protein product [Vicia faba]